jgi:hypothetical protein
MMNPAHAFEGTSLACWPAFSGTESEVSQNDKLYDALTADLQELFRLVNSDDAEFEEEM